MPHPEGLRHVAPLVDEDVERQSRFFDVFPHRLAILREDPYDLDAACGVCGDVGGELTELVAAVRSPGPPVEVQEQTAARQEVDQRADASLLIHDREPRRARERGSAH
jgi:hypothetical protein